MKALIKTDFEKYLLKQLTTELGKYHTFMVGSQKVYVYFEGEKVDVFDAYITIQIDARSTSRISTGAKLHTGVYKFFIYGISALTPDKITDSLANMLDEKIIEETPLSRIDLGVLSTYQRGNKFAGTTHYENITELEFSHWSI